MAGYRSKKKGEEQREIENRYQGLFENMIDGYAFCEMIYDQKGTPIDFRYIEVNDSFEKLTGLSKARVVGKKVSEAIPGTAKANPELLERYGRVASTGIPEVFEVYFVPLKIWLKIGVYSPKKGYFVAVFDNITERKTAEKSLKQARDKLRVYAANLESLVEQRTKELRQAERLAAIGQTAGMVGHDIRNPLQAMISDVYLLKDAIDSISNIEQRKDALESLASLEKNISYINKIVSDLQDYSRVLNPEHVNVNLYELTNEALKAIFVPDTIEYLIEFDPSIRLLSDPTLIKRILSNLITNAIQAMPEGGKLLIGAYKIGDMVSLEVTDTGIGIPKNIRDKLFRPMLTTKAKGQGLGLAVVKRLVEALNGTIGFESEEGKGTKFFIKLPLT